MRHSREIFPSDHSLWQEENNTALLEKEDRCIICVKINRILFNHDKDNETTNMIQLAWLNWVSWVKVVGTLVIIIIVIRVIYGVKVMEWAYTWKNVRKGSPIRWDILILLICKTNRTFSLHVINIKRIIVLEKQVSWTWGIVQKEEAII